MQNLGKSSFFDELSFLTFKKLLEIIENKYSGENPIRHVNSVEEYFNLENSAEIYEKCMNNIKTNYRSLKIRENFNFEWKFLEKLWLVLNPNFDISMKAVNELDGSDWGEGKFIRNKTDASKVFKTITELIGWLYGKKKVGIVVGIDNIESLLGSKKIDKFTNFINMLLDFRNKMSRICLVIIGTTSTWMEFISFLKNSDYYNQFLGLFSSKNISLKFLELVQIKQIVKKHLDRLYSDYSICLPVEFSLYPFSSESIEYLYRIAGKNIRNLKIYLNEYWEDFQKNKKIEFISDAFKIMKKFKKDIILDDYEIDLLYKKLWSEKIKTSGKRSNLVERALQNAFEILKSDPIYNIYNVENNPQIKIKVNSKIRKVKPDIVVSLASKFNIGNMKKIEFQVKIYEKNNSVLRSHVETSKRLLEQKKIDYVYFVTTADFSKTLISELIEKYPERIGGVSPLTKSQQAYLALMIFYEEIFNKKLTPSLVRILLKNSLGIEIGEFFKKIKELPKISITPMIQPTLQTFSASTSEKEKIEEQFIKIDEIKTLETNIISKKVERDEESYPPAISDILLFMYNREGRYKWQTTFTYIKGKITNYRDEEVKEAFNWLKNNCYYVDKISDKSIKLNQNGINFLKKLNRIK